MSMSHLYGRRGGDEDEDGVEIEKFEISEWDLANEFNPDRRRHRQTKEEATYGVWAEHDSDDERPSFGGKRAKDYTAPVNFVSGGLRKTAAEEKREQDGSDDSDEDGEAPPPPPPPRAAAPRKLQTGGNFKTSQKIFAGNIRPGQDIGSWEKHTRGIGQKLLQKMGYVPGKGLGKNAQGIVNPIEAKVRKGKGAVGAYGNERTQQSIQDFPVVDSEEEEEMEFQRELGQWRKEPGAVKKKPKYSFKTVEELKAHGKISNKSMSQPAGELAQVKVIDMTGREQKVYYSYSQMSQKHSIPEEAPMTASAREQKTSSFTLPELEHNLKLLIELTEQDILQSSRRLQHERDTVVSLRHESTTLQTRLSEESEAVERLEQVLEMVERLETAGEGGSLPLSLEECVQVFQQMQTHFYNEYKSMGLADLAVSAVHPLLNEKLRNWDPLKDCSYGFEEVGQWRAILENTQLQHSVPDTNHMDPYHRLIWEVWVPVLRNCVAKWQPRNVGPMVDLVDCWAPVLPLWILDYVLEQLIFPRLQKEVDNWNPLTDTVPIHSWIHPWLPQMQMRLEPLYSPIRNKLANALQRWHPSDTSARLILQPWKDVFTPGAWEAFMVKNIVPKLALCLGELVVNPHQQLIDPFNWVMDWEGMLSLSSMVGLLEKHFFNKWLQVLCSWLSNNPNYEEITKWYLGWKGMLSEQLLSHPLIKEKLNEALDIMNRAVASGIGGYMQPGAKENIAYLTQTERRKDFQYEPPAPPQREIESSIPRLPVSGPVSAAVPTNFKDLIQAKAEENGIVFMPIVGKRHMGKQLYTFGRIIIYVERGVVFVQGKKTWVPTSLQSLIDMAK
ncbi:tuftelin-interacting protein 11 [Clarias gariepinus]|uniref:tuftelin-interacting protein 11 n=1 Tax=Clarias gariepinus TaxID=13013 RepID=UPI00234D8D61|nr:tuftelin-interacting protein 11 [Clarias gariepinus]